MGLKEALLNIIHQEQRQQAIEGTQAVRDFINSVQNPHVGEAPTDSPMMAGITAEGGRIYADLSVIGVDDDGLGARWYDVAPLESLTNKATPADDVNYNTPPPTSPPMAPPIPDDSCGGCNSGPGCNP